MLGLVSVEALTHRHLYRSLHHDPSVALPTQARRGIRHHATRVLSDRALLQTVPLGGAPVDLREQPHTSPRTRRESGVVEQYVAVAISMSAGTVRPTEQTRFPRARRAARRQMQPGGARPGPSARLQVNIESLSVCASGLIRAGGNGPSEHESQGHRMPAGGAPDSGQREQLGVTDATRALIAGPKPRELLRDLLDVVGKPPDEGETVPGSPQREPSHSVFALLLLPWAVVEPAGLGQVAF